MTVKLLTKHHLEFLSISGGFTGSSEFTIVKTPHCWKSHVAAFIVISHLAVVYTLVNVYVDLVVFTRIAGSS